MSKDFMDENEEIIIEDTSTGGMTISMEELENLTNGLELSAALKTAMGKYNKKQEKRGLHASASSTRVCYPTGFAALDFYIGKDMPHYEKPDVIIKNRGIRDGVQFSIGGTTHKGKSVFAVNVAGNVVRPFIRKGLPSWIEYFTPEEGLEESWLCTCAGLGADAIEKGHIRVTHRHKNHTSSDGLYKLITELHELKTTNREQFEYETTDMKGRPVKKLVPTCVVVDSWSNLTPEVLLDQEPNATYYARKNGINGMFLEQERIMCLEANICFLAIVHAGDKSGIGDPPKREYAAIGASMQINGGKQFHFETELGIVLNRYLHPNSTKLEELIKIPVPEKSKTVEAVVYKSRFGQHDATTLFSLVIDPTYGFCPLKSMLVDAYTYRNMFGYGGAFAYLSSNPEEKFFKKDILNKLKEPEFKARFGRDYANAFKGYTAFKDNLNDVVETRELIDSMF